MKSVDRKTLVARLTSGRKADPGELPPAAPAEKRFLGMSRVEWRCAGVLAAISIAMFWKSFVDPAGMCREDAGYIFQPYYDMAADEIRAGRFPHWNPYAGLGVPLHATLMASVLYPLRWPLFFMPYEVANAANLMVHYFLTGLMMFLLCRRLLKCRPLPAMIGAISFTYCGFCTGHMTHAPYFMALPWMVSAVMLCHLSIEKRRVAHAMGAGISVGLCLLAGAAQPTWMLAFGLGVWAGTEAAVALARRLAGKESSWGAVVWPMLAIGITLAVGVGVGAGQFWPSRQQAQISSLNQHMEWQYVAQCSTHPIRNIVYLTAPFYWGNYRIGSWGEYNWQEHVSYVGIVPLIFAAAAVGMQWRQRWVLRLAIVTVVVSLIAFGKYGPVFELLYKWVPTFDQLRNPSRFFVWGELALAGLAALGAQRLTDAKATRWTASQAAPALIVAALTVCVIVGCLLSLHDIAADPQAIPDKIKDLGEDDRQAKGTREQMASLAAHTVFDDTDTCTWLGVAAGVASAIGAGVLVLRRKVPSGRAMVVLAGLTVFDMAMFTSGALMYTDEDSMVRSTKMVEYLQKNLGLQRYICHTGAGDETSRFRGMIFRVRNVLCNNVGITYSPRQYEIALKTFQGNPRLMELAGVQYLLLPAQRGTHPIYLSLSGEYPRGVYENPKVFPRALLAREVRVIKDPNAAQAEVIGGTSELSKVAILEQDVEGLGPCDANAPADPVTVEQNEPCRFQIKTSAPAPRQLVLTEGFHPEWRCTVDGADTPVLRADGTFMSVRLPAGEHRVEFYYAAKSFHEGLAATCASLVLAVGWIGLSHFRRRKQTGTGKTVPV